MIPLRRGLPGLPYPGGVYASPTHPGICPLLPTLGIPPLYHPGYTLYTRTYTTGYTVAPGCRGAATEPWAQESEKQTGGPCSSQHSCQKC